MLVLVLYVHIMLLSEVKEAVSVKIQCEVITCYIVLHTADTARDKLPLSMTKHDYKLGHFMTSICHVSLRLSQLHYFY